jgi:hypothetical protein
MPNQPQPNTEVEFKKQLTVGGFLVYATVKVVVGATSFRRHGNKTDVTLRGIETETRGSILVGQMKRNGDEVVRGQVIDMFAQLLPGVTYRSLASDGIAPLYLPLVGDYQLDSGQKSTTGSRWSVTTPPSKAFRSSPPQTSSFSTSGHKIGIALELEA